MRTMLMAVMFAFAVLPTGHAQDEKIRQQLPPTRVSQLVEQTPEAGPQVDENTFWDSINGSTNPKGYEEYLRRYPNGRYAEQARLRIQKEEEAVWGAVKDSSNPEPYNIYLRLYPNGRYAEQARLRIQQQEKPIWEAIKKSTNPRDYAAFLHKYPHGHYARQARLRMQEAESEREKGPQLQSRSAESVPFKKEKYAVVRTFFATDRNSIESAKPEEMFGDRRSNLTYGVCDVSIPHDHRIGRLETASLLRFEFRPDPAKHVVLLSTTVNHKDNFFTDVAANVRSSTKGDAFIFVHGFNVSFEDAARRAAQIAYDLDFDGAPVFYSWPSKGRVLDYMADEQNIEWSTEVLRGFLDDFFIRSKAQNVYLIAHSMGNRAVTRAIAALFKEKPELRGRLKEVVLTAPDIDAGVFQRDIAPALAATGRPITLYASSEDEALALSQKLHAYPRAGQSGNGLVILPPIETIDATGRDTGFLKHSYYAEDRTVISDMYYLIRGQRADQRFGLRRLMKKEGPYWEFKR